MVPKNPRFPPRYLADISPWKVEVELAPKIFSSPLKVEVALLKTESVPVAVRLAKERLPENKALP